MLHAAGLRQACCVWPQAHGRLHPPSRHPAAPYPLTRPTSFARHNASPFAPVSSMITWVVGHRVHTPALRVLSPTALHTFRTRSAHVPHGTPVHEPHCSHAPSPLPPPRDAAAGAPLLTEHVAWMSAHIADHVPAGFLPCSTSDALFASRSLQPLTTACCEHPTILHSCHCQAACPNGSHAQQCPITLHCTSALENL